MWVTAKIRSNDLFAIYTLIKWYNVLQLKCDKKQGCICKE